MLYQEPIMEILQFETGDVVCGPSSYFDGEQDSDVSDW